MIPVYCFEVQRKFLSRYQVFSIDDWTKEQRCLIEFLKNDLHNIKINHLQYYITNRMSCWYSVS